MIATRITAFPLPDASCRSLLKVLGEVTRMQKRRRAAKIASLTGSGNFDKSSFGAGLPDFVIPRDIALIPRREPRDSATCSRDSTSPRRNVCIARLQPRLIPLSHRRYSVRTTVMHDCLILLLSFGYRSLVVERDTC